MLVRRGACCGQRQLQGPLRCYSRPEPPDSWERIEEDAQLNPDDYWMHHSESDEDRKNVALAMARDILHRCVALAERDER